MPDAPRNTPGNTPRNTPHPDPRYQHMQKLREWRNRPDPDLSLGFLQRVFKQEVEKPYHQLSDIAALWQELLPEDLSPHTRLESLSRGVLRVIVDSSSRHYELDRLLRGGLMTELTQRHRGPALRRIQIKVGQFDENERRG